MCATSVSACHWTPTTKPSPSIPSIVPSGARATTRRPSPSWSTAWWWKELTASVRVRTMRCRRERASISTSCVGLGRRLGLAVARDVLVQRPAAGDVERLRAAADREDRQAALQAHADEAQLERVQARLGRAELDVAVGRAVGGRVEVRAAGETEAVEAVEQRTEVVGAGRRQHHGDRAGGVERAQIGHPQRHLGVRGLAVTARRRKPLGRSSEVVTPMRGRIPRSSAALATIRTHRWSKFHGLGIRPTVGF